MKLRRNIRTYIVLAGFFSLILFSSLFLLNHLLMRADVQQYIIRGVCNRLGMDIQAEKMEFDILGITGLNLKQVRVRFRDTGRSMEAMNLHFRFSKRKLLAGDFFPVRIGISHPVIRLDETDLMAFVRKKEKGEFNAAAIFKGAFRSLNIENGTLIVEGPSGMGINGFYLRVEKVPGRANTFELSGRCEAGYKGKNANFNWGGNVLINTDDIRESLFKVELAADSAPLEWVPWPAKYVKMEKGAAESALIISGSINQGITIEGTIRPGPVLFTLANKGRSKSFEVNPLDCTIKASVRDRSIDIIAFEMKNKELDLSLDSFIDLTEKENPFIRLRAESLFMPIEVFARYFPFQITSPWLKEKLFPLFQQGRVRMDELLIEGKADQLRNLSDEKNRSVIGMTLTCESFTLGNMGIEMPVSGVSATVDIRDSNLAVDGLSGVFGQSRVNEARVHVMHMTSDTPLFTISVDGDYDIQELLTHRHFETIPQTAREKIEAYTGLVGRLSGKTIIGYQSDWEGPRMITGDFNFTETIYHKSPLELPLRFSRITFNFPENKPGNFEGSGLWGDMPFGLQGSTLLKGGGLEFTGAEIKGQADINRLVRSGLISDKFPFMLRKPLPVRVNVKKEGASYIYSGEIDTKNLVLETDMMLINAVGRGNRILFDLLQPDSERLILENIKVMIGKSIINLSGEYSLSKKHLNNLRVISNDLSLQDIGIRAWDRKNSFTGLVGCTLDLFFPEKGWKGVQITGNITGNSITLEEGLFPFPIDGLSFHMDLAGEKGFINKWDMRLKQHPLSIKGILHGWDSLKSELFVTSEYLDLTEIIMGSSEFEPWQGKDKFNIPDTSLKISAQEGTWRGLAFNKLSTEISITDDYLAIKNLSAGLEHGKILLNGAVDWHESGNMDIVAMVTLENQPMDKLLADTGFNDIDIRGNLAIDASLTVKGVKKEGIIKNLSGRVDNLTVTQGLLKHSMIFPRILESLNIPDKFVERPEGMREEKGFYFHSFKGIALIEKGVLNTDEFVIKSPAFNAVGSGEENLDLKTHDIRFLVQPLGNLDFILSRIPIVGKILVEDNKTLFTVGYNVTGPWSKPRMVMVPTENLKGLLGVFKRTLLTPVRIIENLREMTKPAQEEIEGKGNKDASGP